MDFISSLPTEVSSHSSAGLIQQSGGDGHQQQQQRQAATAVLVKEEVQDQTAFCVTQGQIAELVQQIVLSIFNVDASDGDNGANNNNNSNQTTAPSSPTPPKQLEQVDDQHLRLPYTILVAMSPIFIFALTWLVQRKNGRRPGCPLPLPVVDPCRQRVFYAAFWGMVTYECVQFILDPSQLIVTTQGVAARRKLLILLANVPLYALLYYPIIGGFSTHTLPGYLVATLWTWALTALRIVDVYGTVRHDANGIEEFADIFKKILPIIFSLFLTVYLPFQATLAMLTIVSGTKKYFDAIPKLVDYKLLPEGLYVRHLLSTKSPRDQLPKAQPFWRQCFSRIIYKNIPHFRYSQTVISTVVISGVFIYYVFYGYFRVVIVSLPANRAMANNLTLAMSRTLNISRKDHVIQIVEAYFDAMNASFVLTGVVVLAIQVFLLGTVLPCYRRAMLSAYRGCSEWIPARYKSTPRAHFSNSIIYMGQQAVMFIWGCAFQLTVFSWFFLITAWVIVVPIVYGFGWWIIERVFNVLPAIAVTVSARILLRIIVGLFFTEDRGNTMAVRHRRIYSNLSYVAFFHNLIVGLVGVVMRLLSSIVLGVITFSRLDLPMFNRHIEHLDRGFNFFVGLIHVENSHMNPCLVTFVNIILEALEKRRAELFCSSVASSTTDSERGEMSMADLRRPSGNCGCISLGHHGVAIHPRYSKILVRDDSGAYDEDPTEVRRVCCSRRARAISFKWHLLYTLIRNPKLVALRKKPSEKSMIL